MVDNGCPKCEKLAIEKYGKRNLSSCYAMILCLDCQLEQVEATKEQAENQVEEIKQKIAKEVSGRKITPGTHPEKYIRINGIL